MRVSACDPERMAVSLNKMLGWIPARRQRWRSRGTDTRS